MGYCAPCFDVWTKSASELSYPNPTAAPIAYRGADTNDWPPYYAVGAALHLILCLNRTPTIPNYAH